MSNFEHAYVALASDHSGKYVRAGVGSESYLAACSSWIGAWETFEVGKLSGDNICLKSALSGQYVRAGVTSGCFLAATSNHVDYWETFKLINLGGDKIALHIDNSYVRAGVGPYSRLAATSPHRKDWETFRLLPTTMGELAAVDWCYEIDDSTGPLTMIIFKVVVKNIGSFNWTSPREGLSDSMVDWGNIWAFNGKVIPTFTLAPGQTHMLEIGEVPFHENNTYYFHWNFGHPDDIDPNNNKYDGPTNGIAGTRLKATGDLAYKRCTSS